MPIVGQIQPNYLQPHVATYINDNTEFSDSAAPKIDDSIKMMYVVTSPRGRDNIFLTHTNEFDWIAEYGTPSLIKHGQAGYMAYNSLKTGLCTTKTMRVMPEDATHANALIALKMKTDPTDPKKLTVKHTCSFQKSVKDKGDLLAALEGLRNEDPDADGFITLPLMAIYSLGRGVYGDEYRVRLTQSAQMDRENDYKNIKLEIMGAGLRTLGFFEGAVSIEAIEGKRSIFVQDFVNDVTSGSNDIAIEIDPSTIAAFATKYSEIDPDVTPLTIDPFGFMSKAQKTLPGLTVDATTVVLDTIEGITLSGGSDGSFADSNALRQENINKVLVQAFKGEINSAITSRRRTPADVLLDAGYESSVKRALIDLAVKRASSGLYLDSGNLTTSAQAIDWATDMENIGPYALSKNTQCYKIRDPFNYRPITVSITYLFATAIPVHFKTKGRFVPFAGPDVKLANMIPGSLLPVIDSDDKELKEALYTKRVNFFECVSENVFCRGSQTSAQNIWSDLSEEHNVHELFDIKRTIEDYAATNIYDFSEVEDRNRFTEDARMLFSNRIGTRLRKFEVKFEMNKWEEERSILHCYIVVVFKTITKRVIVEIDIDKRV